MTAPERSRTRPTAPVATTCPASSTSSSSTPGTGRPTVVATTSSGSPGWVPVPSEVSVDVYRTTTGQPRRSRMARTSSGGTRDAPVPATRSDDTSACSKSGWASISAHWVGTPCPTVTRSPTRSSMAVAAVHGWGAMTVVTPWAISSHGRVMYPTWAKGNGDSRRSPGCDRTSVPAATAARLRWSKTAPFGTPVDPLVHTTATGSAAASVANRGARSAAASARSRRSTSCPASGGTAASATRARSTTVTAGRVRAVMEACSAGARRRFTPVVMAPRRAAA